MKKYLGKCLSNICYGILKKKGFMKNRKKLWKIEKNYEKIRKMECWYYWINMVDMVHWGAEVSMLEARHDNRGQHVL